MTLLEKLEKFSSDDIEELVLEAAADIAAEANSQGLEAQMEFLQDVCGFEDEDILRTLEIDGRS